MLGSERKLDLALSPSLQYTVVAVLPPIFGAIHAKRVTLQDKDIRLVKNIAEMHGIKVYQPWDKQQSMNMLQKRMTHSLSCRKRKALDERGAKRKHA